MEQIWQFLDLLVVTVGFRGSVRVPKVVPICLGTFRRAIFGRVSQKCEGFPHILQILQNLDSFSFSSHPPPCSSRSLARAPAQGCRAGSQSSQTGMIHQPPRWGMEATQCGMMGQAWRTGAMMICANSSHMSPGAACSAALDAFLGSGE